MLNIDWATSYKTKKVVSSVYRIPRVKRFDGIGRAANHSRPPHSPSNRFTRRPAPAPAPVF